MSNSIDKTYNAYLGQVKEMVDYLYSNSLANEEKQEQRSLASYREMISTSKELEDYEDNFQDLSKVSSEIDVIKHGEEYSLMFTAQVRDFNEEYKRKKVYPMVMTDGAAIPGSIFYEIFNDNSKYWGFISDEVSDTSFELRTKEKESANRIYLSTTHECDVQLSIKSNYEDDWISLGTQEGREHVWNIWPVNIVMLRFETTNNIFGIRYVALALCKYKTYGKLYSKLYDIDDLYSISIENDTDTPSGTDLEYYGILDGNRFELSPTEDNIITGGIDWGVEDPYDPAYDLTLDSDLVEDSIIAYSGYKKWNIINTVDMLWEENDFEVLVYTASGVINIGAKVTESYIVPEDSVKKVYAGTREFDETSDFGVISDNTSVGLDFISTEIANASNLTADVVLRVENPVKQARTYVHTAIEKDVVLDFSGITNYDHAVIRVVNITDTINSEVLIATSAASETITIDVGVNLIELIFYDASDDLITPLIAEVTAMTDFEDLDYFASNFQLKRIYTDDTDDKTYYLDKSPTDVEFKTDASDVYVRYAIHKDVEFQLEVIFKGTGGWITPVVRSYKLINKAK